MVSKSASSFFQLGLVGAGRMGRTHLRALHDASDVKVVAVAEPIDALREEVVTTYGLKGVHSVEELLALDELDGVLIVSPSDTHVEVIGAVARAGRPILCEKPCGVSPEDTARARELVAQSHVPLQIAYWRRFVPELQELRARIAAGELGEILSLSCLQWDGEPPSSAFRARSGGVFVDMGVHEFDQARWLTNSNVTKLSAMASAVVTDPEANGDPDSAQVLMSMDGDATVFVSLGRHYAGGDMASVEVFGTLGHELLVFLDPDDGERAQLDALRRQATAFARYAHGAQRQGANVDDALAALDAATDAARQIASAR